MVFGKPHRLCGHQSDSTAARAEQSPPPVPTHRYGTPLYTSEVAFATKPQHAVKPPVPSHHHGAFLTTTPPASDATQSPTRGDTTPPEAKLQHRPPPPPPRRRAHSDPTGHRPRRPSESPCTVDIVVSDALLAQIRGGVVLKKTAVQPHPVQDDPNDELLELLHNVKLRKVGLIERPTKFEPPVDSVLYKLAGLRHRMGEDSDDE